MTRTFALVLFCALAAAAHAQSMFGARPPGFGPELDQTFINQFRSLQTFLTGDLGLTLTGDPKVRDNLEVRRFWGSFQLDSFYRNKFIAWKHKLMTSPGQNGLGIDISGMDYSMALMSVDYNNNQLGDYTMFHLQAGAQGQLAKDAKKLYLMAQGYIDRLNARLEWEKTHSPLAPRAANDPHPDWPRPAIHLLDVIGEDRTRAIIESRRK
jgi:hypothetical protein